MNNKSATIDETLAKNPFYEKYASKITTLQQYIHTFPLPNLSQALDHLTLIFLNRNDPAKLAEKLDKLTTGSKNVSSTTPAASSSGFSTASSFKKADGQGEGSRGKFMQSQTKKLEAIMKTELLKDKNFDEIKQVKNF